MKPYFNSIIIVAICFISKYVFEFSLFNNLELESLESNLIIQCSFLVEYLLFLSIIFLIVQRNEETKFSKITKHFSYTTFLIVIILTAFLRIGIDPIFRFYNIIGKSEIPSISNISYLETADIVLLFRVTVVAPIFEEIVFRKLLLYQFTKKNESIIKGILFTSLLFGLVHIQTLTIGASIFLGLLTAIIYLRYGIFYSILSHSFYNLIWYFFNYNPNVYWTFLEKLDFGLLYWSIIIISIVILLVYGKKKLSEIRLEMKS